MQTLEPPVLPVPYRERLFVKEQDPVGRGAVNDILLPKGPPPFPPNLLGSLCPLPEEGYLSMPEIGEKERNYSFKGYTDLE